MTSLNPVINEIINSARKKGRGATVTTPMSQRGAVTPQESSQSPRDQREESEVPHPPIFSKKFFSSVPQPPTPAMTLNATKPAVKSSDVNDHDPTGHWVRNANTLLLEASAEMRSSANMRGENHKKASDLSKKVSAQQQVVTERLKRRIKETKAFRTKLYETEHRMHMELKLLINGREKVMELIEKLQKPLHKCAQRTTIRAQRPVTENIEDKASQCIEVHASSVKKFMLQLNDVLLKAEAQACLLTKQIQVVQQDIQAKAHAIQIDEECVAFANNKNQVPESMGQGNTLPQLDDLPSVALLPNAAQGPYAVHKSVTQPDLWKHVSTYNIEVGRTLSADAKEIRLKMLSETKRIYEQQKSCGQNVTEQLNKKLVATHRFSRMINAELKKVEQEIATMESQHKKVYDSLQEKRVPLDVVRKRLEARISRTGNEKVRDEVEIELEKEFDSLVKVVKNLEERLTNMEKELASLRGQRSKLKADLLSKEKAIGMDQQCLQFDALTGYNVSSRGGTPFGGPSNGLQHPVVPQPYNGAMGSNEASMSPRGAMVETPISSLGRNSTPTLPILPRAPHDR